MYGNRVDDAISKMAVAIARASFIVHTIIVMTGVRMKIRRKLVLSILTAMLVILAVLEALSYRESRRALVAEIRENATKILEANVALLDGTFQAVAGVARGLAMSALSRVCRSVDCRACQAI